MSGRIFLVAAESSGDALGADCVIQSGLPQDGASGFVRPFRTDGSTNEDWYGWNAQVLAPFDGVVVRLNVNAAANTLPESGAIPEIREGVWAPNLTDP